MAPLLEVFRQSCLLRTGLSLVHEGLLDIKPVPVIGYPRSKKSTHFAGSADYGYCASRKLHYYGYKLVAISTTHVNTTLPLHPNPEEIKKPSIIAVSESKKHLQYR